MSTNILIVGGCGYIGSHIATFLLNKKFNITILDNLSNSNIEVIDTIKHITNRSLSFIKGDVRNKDLVYDILIDYDIDVVIHLANLKSVSESQYNPLLYIDNNINGTISLLQAMEKANVHRLIYSSSATVYSKDNKAPFKENMTLGYTNNYAYTKITIENMLINLSNSNPSWSIAILRYFNPIGSHESGLLGDPLTNQHNLLPHILNVFSGNSNHLSIYGNDYDTHDGTCIRDYIHIEDLVDVHSIIIDHIKSDGFRYDIWNVGSNNGYSVMDVIKTFNNVSNFNIPYKIAERRDGDIGTSLADSTKLYTQFQWKPKYSLRDMIKSSYYYYSCTYNNH